MFLPSKSHLRVAHLSSSIFASLLAGRSGSCFVLDASQLIIQQLSSTNLPAYSKLTTIKLQVSISYQLLEVIGRFCVRVKVLEVCLHSCCYGHLHVSVFESTGGGKWSKFLVPHAREALLDSKVSREEFLDVPAPEECEGKVRTVFDDMTLLSTGVARQVQSP